MFNSPYMTADQNYLNVLDREKERIDKMRENYINRQPSINQTFQLAPNGVIKYVNSFEDVQKELTIVDTPFISNDFSTLWIKSPKGEIRTFAIQEIKPKDEKDLIIEKLQLELQELKGRIDDVKSNDEYPSPNENGPSVESIKTTKSSSNTISKPIKTK